MGAGTTPSPSVSPSASASPSPSASASASSSASASPSSDGEGEGGWWAGIDFGDEATSERERKERRAAAECARAFHEEWRPALDGLSKAGRVFDFAEELIGGRDGHFDAGSAMWRRKGWDSLDELRRKLQDCKSLRDVVRSLGRGAGWGPLRRSPAQTFSEKGRDGLIRSILEQQETRGLCRSDDLSRMLPCEAVLLAKGRTQRFAKLMFFSKMVEKALLSYERDGWSEQPTIVPNPLVREIRPTADQGPILLCIDTSGSMRGKREVVAKALTLECMRSARQQERGCYVFCFSGPSQVKELELNSDPKSLETLLAFLETTFNGGSDFNEPIRRCMDRLLMAKWANSDIMIVSDGELRLPEPELTRKLQGAKHSMALRVHGVVLPASQTIRVKDSEQDTSVLRSLCTNPVRGGKEDIAVHVFNDWGALETDIFAEEELAISAAVDRGKMVEEWRQREIERLQAEKAKGGSSKREKKLAAHPGMKYDKASKQDLRDKKLRAHPGMKYDKATKPPK